MTYEEIKKQAIEQIEFIARTSWYFKIGKTSQILEDRRRQSDYLLTYSKIISILANQDANIIGYLEKDLISHFKEFLNCHNKQEGGGADIADKIYVVYIPKFKLKGETKSGILKYQIKK